MLDTGARLSKVLVPLTLCCCCSCADSLQACGDLVEARAVQLNIITAIESLSACLPVIKLYVKAKQQLAAQRYYPTLKTLQDLEANHLPSVRQ